MDAPTFYNRERELEQLRRTLSSPRPELFVVYGRRRVGKSALLRQACAGRRHIFFTADLGTRQDQLSAFGTALAQGLAEPEWATVRFETWEAALRFLAARAREKPLVLVLDEFQHLVRADPSLPSVLQRLWDAELQGLALSIVLCGSYVSFMEREVLGADKPLFGRRTGQLLVQPLEARHAALFFPSWTAGDRMRAVAVLGGIPAYLRQFTPERGFDANLELHLLHPNAPLFEEPRFLLMEELREPQIYFSICRAIAHGAGRPNEIAQAAGQITSVGLLPYLTALRELRLVDRIVPASIRNPERTRRSLYRLSDDFLRFWFRFVLPNRTALEGGDAATVRQRKIEPHLAQFVAPSFEEACRQHLRELHRTGVLPAVYDRIGSWWQHAEEVDIAAVADDGPLLLGECKWTAAPVDLDVLRQLEAKSAAVVADLERPPTRIDYALYSRAGFTPRLQKEAKARGILLFEVEDVLGRSEKRRPARRYSTVKSQPPVSPLSKPSKKRGTTSSAPRSRRAPGKVDGRSG